MKSKRPRRRVIVFLVEGFSELRALSPTIAALYDSIDSEYEVFFPSMTEDGSERWGDLTAKHGINPSTIEKCIGKLYFRDFLAKEKLYPKDITEVIHIFDMDGAYIEDSNIVFGHNPTGGDKPFYGDGQIITTRVDSITERNKRKRENIDYLYSLSKLKIESKSIPYSVYFFSSNMDHFLYNDANITDGRTKVQKADEYAMNYVNKPQAFIQAIRTTPGVMADMSYEAAWSYIRERGSHSIDRHSNVCVLFEKLLLQSPTLE